MLTEQIYRESCVDSCLIKKFFFYLFAYQYTNDQTPFVCVNRTVGHLSGKKTHNNEIRERIIYRFSLGLPRLTLGKSTCILVI